MALGNQPHIKLSVTYMCILLHPCATELGLAACTCKSDIAQAGVCNNEFISH